MSTKRKLTPLALAVAALFASPLALAQEVAVIAYTNGTNVELNHQSSLQNAISVVGVGVAQGVIPFTAESGATIDTKQQSVLQTGVNSIVNNNASVDGGAMQNAQGNAGVNAAAGDNNVQTNDGALSSVDAVFVFANAQSFGYQTTTANGTVNTGTNNSASVAGNAFMNFQGNVGLNVAAGNSNAQANAMAASNNNSGSLAKATSYTNQVTSANTTANTGFTEEVVQQVPFEVTQVINQAGDQLLSATVSGNIPVVLTVLHPHANTATLGGNAFMGASGNLGVNIASGTNNLQRNSLAIAVAQAAPGGGTE